MSLLKYTIKSRNDWITAVWAKQLKSPTLTHNSTEQHPFILLSEYERVTMAVPGRQLEREFHKALSPVATRLSSERGGAQRRACNYNNSKCVDLGWRIFRPNPKQSSMQSKTCGRHKSPPWNGGHGRVSIRNSRASCLSHSQDISIL